MWKINRDISSHRFDARWLPGLVVAMGGMILPVGILGLSELALPMPHLLIVLLLLVVSAQLSLIAGLLSAIVLRPPASES